MSVVNSLNDTSNNNKNFSSNLNDKNASGLKNITVSVMTTVANSVIDVIKQHVPGHTQQLPSGESKSDLHSTSVAINRYRDFYIGLTLALASSFFIGSSFILKKKGLLKLCGSTSLSPNKATLRAGQGGYGYLKEWLWWSGFITMGVGELCNFAAYGFVPATLVTPLGALSVLISAIMSAHFLNEKLNTIGKIGCLLTAIGSTVMVIHAPKEGEVKSVKELLYRIQDPEFICFTVLSIISLFILIFMLVPKYGNTNVLVYILICSILGSFTVMSCKGLSLGIKELFSTHQSVSVFYTYLFAILVVACIVVQMNYLNKSLDIFNTPIVTTVYYVLFTLFVMIASALLFKEFFKMSFQDFVGCICGFSTIVCALFLIQFFKTSSDNDDPLKYDIHQSSNPTNQRNLERSLFKVLFNESRKQPLQPQQYTTAATNFHMHQLTDEEYDQTELPPKNFPPKTLVQQQQQQFKNDQPVNNETAFTNPNSATSSMGGSLLKRLAGNYKNFQKKLTTLNPSNGGLTFRSDYNYNKLNNRDENFQIDDVDFDDDYEDDDDDDNDEDQNPKGSFKKSTVNEIFDKNKYRLLNNKHKPQTNTKNRNFDANNYKKYENNFRHNLSLDEKLFSTTTSIVGNYNTKTSNRKKYEPNDDDSATLNSSLIG